MNIVLKSCLYWKIERKKVCKIRNPDKKQSQKPLKNEKKNRKTLVITNPDTQHFIDWPTDAFLKDGG